MKDYSTMSDFEINKAVGELTGEATNTEPVFDMVIRNANGRRFYPCKNPTDAYPIMLEHGIGIDYDGISWTASDWRENKHSDWRNHPESPLRLAMIVFLIMKDRESSHA
ncbi:TPA: DUF2591 family protein [Yersinia enterocolitica]|nr:DUF2591 family protein [Yersinia enterocolitica]HEM8997891.1 DUF2591 family protein [Yersinia enterocolitica]HEO8481662.1 DUF2591 family protein [Yersinia enterocolitica]